jgi:tetratricopeptide (TPR) repeat protein
MENLLNFLTLLALLLAVVCLFFLLIVSYLLVLYLLTDHETQAEKDVKRYKAGIQLVKNKKYGEASRYFDKVIKEKPNCAIAYAYRGKCNLYLDNLYSCVFDCTLASSLDGTLAEVYLDKGKALYQLEEYTQSFLEFDKAVWYFRNSAKAFRWRALARIRLSQEYNWVETDFLKAIHLGDEDAAHYLRLIRCQQEESFKDNSVGKK